MVFKKISKTVKFIISIIICQLAGLLGAFFTFDSVNTWYKTLNAPFFNPPSWVFGPVWTFLYILMGISFFIIWTQNKTVARKRAIQLFLFQLVLNSLWSPLFFGLKSPLIAFIEIVILWFAIVATFLSFKVVSKPAAYLLVPYLLWVTFATALNFSFMVLN